MTGVDRFIVTVVMATLAVLGGIRVSPADAAVRQPRQPTGGPGGSATPFGGVRITHGGTGVNAWEILEPTLPTPPSAPLVIVMHGYYEFSGYTVNGALAQHTALQGNVVIYPRWQTGVATPCPGPLNIQPCIDSATTAIRSAIAFLHGHPCDVQPRLNETSYFGFSFGGILTANMTNRWETLHLPKPRAIFLDDPHDGGLTGDNEPALDPSLAGIPSTTKVVCHAGADGVISLTDPAGQSLRNGSCNAVLPKLRACALYGTDCRYALGDTAQNRYIGTWSDGVPIIALKIQPRADSPTARAEPPTRTRAGTLGHSTIRDPGENARGQLAHDPHPAARRRIRR